MLTLTCDHNVNIWIFVPWCIMHRIVSIKDDVLFKYTATIAHMLKYHCKIGNMDNPIHILFFQPILTWQALITHIYYNAWTMKWGYKCTTIMIYFYLTNFLDWLSYKLQHLNIKSYSAKQVWIYFNKCIITSSNRATTTDIHKPIWREMVWKEKRFC